MQATQYFRKHNKVAYAKETYIKMDDLKSLMSVSPNRNPLHFQLFPLSFDRVLIGVCICPQLYVETHQWDEAFLLVNGVRTHPRLARVVAGAWVILC